MKYVVGIKEVHTTIVDVELEDSEVSGLTDEELKKKIYEQAEVVRTNNDDLFIEYDHDLDPEYWTVEKV